MKYVIAPDSFKSSIGSARVCEIIASSITRYDTSAIIEKIPMADGGEGFVDALLAVKGGTRIQKTVNAVFQDTTVMAEYGMMPDNSAVIEMASAAGLPLAGGKPGAWEGTTIGVGELMLDAQQNGAKEILLGIGGSAANDGGTGMAHALGWRFLDDGGKVLFPCGKNLSAIRTIIPPAAPMPLRIRAACDVTNPLTGPAGASAVYGPQKGADSGAVRELDKGLSHLAALLREEFDIDIDALPGAGAAGGLGAGLIAFAGAKLESGITLMLDAAGIDEKLKGAALCITGEGRLDGQTVNGKTAAGVALRARSAGVPCIALAGSVDADSLQIRTLGLDAAFSSIGRLDTLENTLLHAEENLRMLADAVLSVFWAGVHSKKSYEA